MVALIKITVLLLADAARFIVLLCRLTQSVEAEKLFFRRRLALYKGRSTKPRRLDAATRISLAVLAGCFDWPDALIVVRPQTMIRWHRRLVAQKWDYAHLHGPGRAGIMPRRRAECSPSNIGKRRDGCRPALWTIRA